MKAIESNGEYFVEGILPVEEHSQTITDQYGNRFIERVSENAFRESLSNNKDLFFLDEHNLDKQLASTNGNTLEVRALDNGDLYFKALVNEETHRKVKRSRFGISFGFVPVKDAWNRTKGQIERVLEQIKLYEISLVKNPAYNASLEARNLDGNTTKVPQNLLGDDDNMNEQMMELLTELNENIVKLNENMAKLVETQPKQNETKQEEPKEDEKEEVKETKQPEDKEVKEEQPKGETPKGEKEVKEDEEEEKEVRSRPFTLREILQMRR